MATYSVCKMPIKPQFIRIGLMFLKAVLLVIFFSISFKALPCSPPPSRSLVDEVAGTDNIISAVVVKVQYAHMPEDNVPIADFVYLDREIAVRIVSVLKGKASDKPLFYITSCDGKPYLAGLGDKILLFYSKNKMFASNMYEAKVFPLKDLKNIKKAL